MSRKTRSTGLTPNTASPTTSGQNSSSNEINSTVMATDLVCKDDLTCNDCKQNFDIQTLNIDKSTLLKIQSTADYGTRWHCATCLKKPVVSESMSNEFNEFQQVMKMELQKITKNFDTKIEQLKASLVSKIEQCTTNQTAKARTSYAAKVRKNLQVSSENIEATYSTPVPSAPVWVPNEISTAATTSSANVTNENSSPVHKPPATANPKSQPAIIISEEELQRREWKKMNLCLFNLPESDALDDSTSYADDMVKLKCIFFPKEGFNPDHVKHAYRIGKKCENKVRPIVMKFSEPETRLNVLKMTDLKYLHHSETVKLYINIDKTKQQVQEYKTLLSELKIRGDPDLIIRNNKIVRKQSFRPTPQSVWNCALSA